MSLADGNPHVIVSIRRFQHALLMREAFPITVGTGLPEDASKLRKTGLYGIRFGVWEICEAH